MNELVKFDPVKADMAEFRQENALLVFNYEDPQGNKDARSHIFKLRKIKTVIADIHKVAKAEALGVCRILDAEKKKLTTEVEEWIDVHHKPIKEIEEREAKAAAVQANAERLERIRVEAERAAETERRENELAEKEAAVKAKEDALIREQEKQEAAKQAEISKVAAIMRANEQAERDKVLAAERAEREKQAAVEAEQEKAQQEAQRIKDEAAKIAADLVAERRRLADEASQEAENKLQVKIAADKVEAERIADKEHRGKIHAAIEKALWERVPGVDASGITGAIIAGNIPHVQIIY